MKQAWGKKFKRVGTFCSSIWKKKETIHFNPLFVVR